MVGAGDNLFGSQFILTLDDDLGHLDGDNRVFGEVADGLDVLDKFNEVIVDETHRPFQVLNGARATFKPNFVLVDSILGLLVNP